MDPRHLFKDMTERLCDALPASLQAARKDWEKNVRSILAGTFAKLDLITREEFDTQTKVLARTRKKVEALEAKIAELEQQLSQKKTRK